MFFSSEVRVTEEYAADTREVTQKELDLAQMLIHAQAAAFEPEKYRDTYREKLESIIASRVAGQPVVLAQAPSRTAPVVDITTEALQKSLAALKKPAASEEKPHSAAKSTRTQRKKISHRAG